MQVRLEVVQGAKTKEIILRLPSVIGRGGDAKVKLPASTVSRHHCEVYEYNGQVAVRDLASSNGTIVNGHKIKGPTFLTPEDELTIGPLTARLHPYVEPAPKPAADNKPESAATPIFDPVSASANPAEEVVPSFEELPMEEVQPIEASEADSVVTEPIPILEDDDSVLEYTESQETVGRSFVGIAAVEDAPETVSDAPVFDNIEEPETPLRSDDTSLNNFFKKLDE